MASKGDPGIPERKLWSEESMTAATNSALHDNMTLREASRLLYYTVYCLKTLRRRVNGSVKAGCRPGLGTVPTEKEVGHLALYLVQMADMGVGLSHDAVMRLAYKR